MRKWKLLGLLVVLLAAASFLLWWSPASRFGPDKYARISAGMTQAEVHALLGPPGDFRTRQYDFDYDRSLVEELVAGEGSAHFLLQQGNDIWYGDDGCIGVRFDASGSTTYKCYMQPIDSFESFHHRLVKRWRRLFR
jgi:hypothetical protein